MKADTTHKPVVCLCHPRAVQVAERESCAHTSHLEGRGRALGRESCSLLVFGYCTNPKVHFWSFSNLVGSLDRQKVWEADKHVLCPMCCIAQMYCTYSVPLRNQIWYLHLSKWDTVFQHGKIKPAPPRHRSFDFVTLSRYHRNDTLTDPTDVGSQLIKDVEWQEYWVT